MSFSIGEFRTKGLADGGASPNLFQVQIHSAPVTFPSNNAQGGFSFSCKIAAIPASTLAAFDVPYFGRNVKVVGNRTFDNLSMTVINDEAMEIRNSVENWMAAMNSHVGNTQTLATAGSNISGANFTIQHFAKSGEELGTPWTFWNAFPVSLGEIALDWGSNDTIEEYPIEWAYDYWTHGANTEG